MTMITPPTTPRRIAAVASSRWQPVAAQVLVALVAGRGEGGEGRWDARGGGRVDGRLVARGGGRGEEVAALSSRLASPPSAKRRTTWQR